MSAGRHFELLDTLGHAVIATDINGLITDWSASAEALYGWPRTKVLGRQIVDVTPSSVSRDEAGLIMDMLRRGDVWSGNFRVRRRSGEDFLASVTDVPLLDDAQKLIGIVGLSAPAEVRTPLSTVLRRLAAGCERVWPHKTTFECEVPDGLCVAASDAHLLQLLALVMIRQTSAIQGGSVARIQAAPTPPEFAAFTTSPRRKSVKITFAWSDDGTLKSPLQNFVKTAVPTPYIAKLVQTVDGLLLRGFDQTRWRMIHLILPEETR